MEEQDAAEKRLLHFVQRGAYARDLERLQAGRSLVKGNQLSRLTPCRRWSTGVWQTTAIHRPAASVTASIDSPRPPPRDNTADPTCARVQSALGCGPCACSTEAKVLDPIWACCRQAAAERGRPLQTSLETTVNSAKGATVAKTSDASAETV